jgi:hypothetical protein
LQKKTSQTDTERRIAENVHQTNIRGSTYSGAYSVNTTSNGKATLGHMAEQGCICIRFATRAIG